MIEVVVREADGVETRRSGLGSREAFEDAAPAVHEHARPTVADEQPGLRALAVRKRASRPEDRHSHR
ncbi:hypothetical protein GCM10009021_15290 [Halarchaeum nitratireducens]|uniref:Uncharacterized protein n=1 Tax=Halarchaeum nitratireducens TaxID=489913 RepID=A0A830GCP7_9EURY|nr:hypothetical protein GCM10009021_15290 [Halarchaeum nitratireducens]